MTAATLAALAASCRDLASRLTQIAARCEDAALALMSYAPAPPGALDDLDPCGKSRSAPPPTSAAERTYDRVSD